MGDIWKSEPTSIVTLVQAAIVLATSFGLHLSAEQTGAILTLTAIIAGIIIRSQVHSPSTVEALKLALTTPPAKFPDTHQ